MSQRVDYRMQTNTSKDSFETILCCFRYKATFCDTLYYNAAYTVCYLLSVVQVLHGQPRVALSQTLPRKATVGQGELQAGGRQKW